MGRADIKIEIVIQLESIFDRSYISAFTTSLELTFAKLQSFFFTSLSFPKITIVGDDH